MSDPSPDAEDGGEQAAKRPSEDTEETPAKRPALDQDESELPKELEDLRTSERRTQLELAQQRRRESALVLRLALKEREARDLQTQVRELRQAMRPAHSQVSKLLLDPAVNAEITRLREKVRSTPGAELPGWEERGHRCGCWSCWNSSAPLGSWMVSRGAAICGQGGGGGWKGCFHRPLKLASLVPSALTNSRLLLYLLTDSLGRRLTRTNSNDAPSSKKAH